VNVPQDWYSACSYKEFLMHRAKGVLNHYGNSAKKYVMKTSPELNWKDSHFFSKLYKKAQKSCLRRISKVFGASEIEEDVALAKLSTAKNRSFGDLTFDFYIKNYSLIIELNGAQHYEEGMFTEDLDYRENLDALKRILCVKMGISYLEISDNDWGERTISITKLISKMRPDLFACT